nr:hypothetical protein [Tanacetum cinerariifolium]
MNELLSMMRSFCEKILQQKQATNLNQQRKNELQEMSIQDMEDLKQHYLDEMKSLINDIPIKDDRNEKIDIRYKRKCKSMIDEIKGKFNEMSIEINKKKELQQLEQAANLNTTRPSQCFNSFYYCDDDDYDYEESTIPFNEIISQEPPSNAIKPVLPTIEDPEDSLIMGNAKLNIIPVKKSDEFIKSSVKDLVQILSESEDTSGSDREYDLSLCDDFSPINVLEGNSDECFDPGCNIDEIDAIDIPLNFKYGYYDSKGDVVYLESFLSNDTTPNLPPEVFLDRDPMSLCVINDLMTEEKVFDPGILEKFFLRHM